MIPKPKEWSSWDAIQKITYVAQLTTALSFLGATTFSYLAWNEAHLARVEQKSFFISEKAPRLEIESIYLKDSDINESPTLTVELRNNGDSEVRGFSVRLKSKDNQVLYDSDSDEASKDSLSSVKLSKEKAVIWFIGPIKNLTSNLGGYIIDPAVVSSAEMKSDRKNKKVLIGTVLLEYYNSFGDKYSSYAHIGANIVKKLK